MYVFEFISLYVYLFLTSKPLDLTLTPVAPTSMRRDATQQQHSAGPVHLRCRLDEHISRFYPNHQPTAQEHLRAMLYMHGATEDTLLDYLERYNRGWDRIIASSQMEEFLHLECVQYNVVVHTNTNDL